VSLTLQIKRPPAGEAGNEPLPRTSFYSPTFFGSKESGEKETAVLTTLGGKLSLAR